ncbi:MAG: hypothetical protein PHF00_05915 [Elusimicrobia bacterium]|nr:hypothetical protein [Elusimicrobiota bacterium]
MSGQDGYDFEKLTREMVAAKAAKSPATAAEIAVRTIISGVPSTRERQDPRLTVVGVCRGAMSGMLLLEGDLVATAVELLRAMGQLSLTAHLDPADLMTWAMEGVASVVGMGAPILKSQVRDAIESNFMGAGEVFDGLCEKGGAGRGA